MDLPQLLLITFVAALITDLATGLGAVPFFFMRTIPERLSGVLLATGAGMMTIASIYQLLDEAGTRAPGWGIWQVGMGLALGAGFFMWASHWIESHEKFDIGNLRESGGTGAILIVMAMTIHSLPEGVAIGVAYGSGEAGFGLAVAMALAVHNIPEGIAITAALRGRGASTLACMGWAIFSSIPQPLAAPPAAWLVWLFAPLLPAGLGFAAGAMMFLVAAELIPEATKKSGKNWAAAGFTAGLVAMLLLARVANIWGGGVGGT
ncbi:MAG: ZIP family metal transporter [Phycisphaerae bacterium]